MRGQAKSQRDEYRVKAAECKRAGLTSLASPALYVTYNRSDWTRLELFSTEYRACFRSDPPSHIRELLAIMAEVA